jgi:four helix bundle protein
VYAQDTARFCRPLLRQLDTRDTALQLKRAATSAAANHRAAGRARSRREFVAKLGLAQEEADEAVFWIEHLVGSDAVPAEVGPLLAEGRELLSILTRSYTTARDRVGRT